MSFTIGEEVMYRGQRYAISIGSPPPPYDYRLVRTTPDGAEIVWVQAGELGKMDDYTRPRDDTQLFRGSRPKRR